MGGIVSKNNLKQQEVSQEKENPQEVSQEKNVDETENILTEEQIEMIRKKRLEREIKQMELQLLYCYEKWDKNKRIQHEDTMVLYNRTGFIS